MYTAIILDYYRHPRNYGTIRGADIMERDLNPLCGDEIEMHVKLEGSIIKEIKFSGHGCAISQAAASMLTEMVAGKTLDDARRVSRQDMLDALGIPISPARLKCALLGLKVLKTGVYRRLGAGMKEEFW